MSWFKTILLLSVLGMTWAECDRRPIAASHAWPEAAFELAPPARTSGVEGAIAGDGQPTYRQAGPHVIAEWGEPSQKSSPTIQ